MDKKITVIQLGGNKIKDTPLLDDKIENIYLSLNDPEKILIAQNFLFEKNSLKNKYKTAVYILGVDSYVYLMPNLLVRLPSNRIIYDKNLISSKETLDLLERKGALEAELNDSNKLRKQIDDIFYLGQYGDRLEFNKIDVLPNFANKKEQLGSGELSLVSLKLSQFTQVINWRMTLLLEKNRRMEFWPEFKLIGSGSVFFKLYIIKSGSGEILRQYEVSSDNKSSTPFTFDTPRESSMVFVSAFLKGDIERFSVRNLFIRRSRNGFGNYMVNSTMITDFENCKGQLGVYFSSGDFKPPLNVYFSGYRTAVGFEGAGIMSTVGDGNAPYLLIADERLEGGAFYIGNSALERKIVETIKHYLILLGFTEKDLVLSGISMGTTAALYYSANLKPATVIVAKPLVNMGNIAANERINRPYGFSTSLDLLLINEKSSDYRAQERLNNHFWINFKKGNFENTEFNIAYMKQDDYDENAFDDIFNCLKTKYPNIKLLYKGLVGRHNDDTPGVVSWFMKRYEDTMAKKYFRKKALTDE